MPSSSTPTSTDAVFEATDLSRIRLTGALLTETRFTDCRMIGADLSGLRGLAVTYRLDGSNLGLANLQDVSWRAVTLRGLDLSEADLRGADLRDAMLLDCTLRDVDLAHTRLAGADLRGADLGELTEDARGRCAGRSSASRRPPTCAARWAWSSRRCLRPEQLVRRPPPTPMRTPTRPADAA